MAPCRAWPRPRLLQTRHKSLQGGSAGLTLLSTAVLLLHLNIRTGFGWERVKWMRKLILQSVLWDIAPFSDLWIMLIHVTHLQKTSLEQWQSLQPGINSELPSAAQPMQPPNMSMQSPRSFPSHHLAAALSCLGDRRCPQGPHSCNPSSSSVLPTSPRDPGRGS